MGKVNFHDTELYYIITYNKACIFNFCSTPSLTRIPHSKFIATTNLPSNTALHSFVFLNVFQHASGNLNRAPCILRNLRCFLTISHEKYGLETFS